MGDDDIAFEYREKVVGKTVWIKLKEDEDTKYLEGTITAMHMFHPDHNINNPVAYEHYICFGEKDHGYYNLTEYEKAGDLQWNAPEGFVKSTEKQQPVAASAPATPPRTAAARTAATVTPEKRAPVQQQQDSSNKRVKVKVEPGSVRTNIDDPSNDKIDTKELKQWLQYVHKGLRGQSLSVSNIRSVMNRAKDLISGRGVGYKNWPDGVRFNEGQCVSLGTNFETLLELAQLFEDTHGEDKGHGWLLRHPIKKLLLFKKYIQDKRHERENPIRVY